MFCVAHSQHYICWSELPMPRIAVTFSLQEVEEIERDCAVYRGRLERIAKYSAISREEQVLTHTCRFIQSCVLVIYFPKFLLELELRLLLLLFCVLQEL